MSKHISFLCIIEMITQKMGCDTGLFIVLCHTSVLSDQSSHLLDWFVSHTIDNDHTTGENICALDLYCPCFVFLTELLLLLCKIDTKIPVMMVFRTHFLFVQWS